MTHLIFFPLDNSCNQMIPETVTVQEDSQMTGAAVIQHSTFKTKAY